MSASDSALPKRTLRIEVLESLSDVTITTAQFQIALSCPASESSPVEIDLAPGLYRVTFRNGAAASHVDVELWPGDAPLVVRQRERLAFRSPIPIPGTTTTHEWHEGPLRDLAARLPEALGAGGSAALLLVIRDVGRARLEAASEESAGSEAAERSVRQSVPPVRSAYATWDELSASRPHEGATLHGSDGRLLHDLASPHVEGPGFAGWSFTTDEPCLRLRVATTRGAIESALALSDGWQLQAFLPCRTHAGGERRADPDNVALGMTRLPLAAAPGGLSAEEWYRRNEIARMALARRRPGYGAEISREWLDDPADPILGVYGAHLQLLEDEVDAGLLQATIAQLDRLLPPGASNERHPDLASLHVGASRTIGAPLPPDLHVSLPPLLEASWLWIVEQAAESDDLIREGSLAESIADRLVSGPGTSLTWIADAGADGSASRDASDGRSIAATVAPTRTESPRDRPATEATLQRAQARLRDPLVSQWLRAEVQGTTGGALLDLVEAISVSPGSRPSGRSWLSRTTSSSAGSGWDLPGIATRLGLPLSRTRRLIEDLDHRLSNAPFTSADEIRNQIAREGAGETS